MNGEVLSALKIRHMVVDKLSFIRKGFQNKGNEDIDFQIGVSVNQIEEANYQVAVSVTADKHDEYIAEVQMTAYCEIDEDYSGKNDLLEKNAVAILFPYIRAQLTLLTSQPEVDPIVFPALNINDLIENAKNKPE